MHSSNDLKLLTMAQLVTRKQCVIIIGLLTIFILQNLTTVQANKKTEKPEATTVPNVRKHVCCARQQKMVNAGHGISGEVIQIDVGFCKSFCPRHFVDDPGDASRPAVQKCMPNMLCRPRTARLERVSTIEGVRTIEVVDTCDCSTGHSCQRVPYSQTLYMGTPHQVEIDVGACIGSCKKFNCRPLRNSSVSVRGPNGDEVYQIINKCSCAKTCHRMDHMETIKDFSGIEIKENMRIADVKPIVRQINVGQCVGTCSGNSTETCLLRDRKNPLRCLAGLYSGSHSCTPAKFKVHEYRNRRGMKREIIQITQCACI